MKAKQGTQAFDPNVAHEGVSDAPVGGPDTPQSAGETLSVDEAEQRVEATTTPPPVAPEHPVASTPDFSPKTDEEPNTAEAPLLEPSAEARADPTNMNVSDDPNVTHVPPEDGLADAGEDKSFDNKNAPVASSSGGTDLNPSVLHAGNAMGRGPADPEITFSENFGMARDVNDPSRDEIPEGQLQSVPVKDGKLGQTVGDTPGVFDQFSHEREPSLVPTNEGVDEASLKYLVTIQPVHLPNSTSVLFKNGGETMDVPVGREVPVTEAIYHAIKDSSIPFAAKPKP